MVKINWTPLLTIGAIAAIGYLIFKKFKFPEIKLPDIGLPDIGDVTKLYEAGIGTRGYTYQDGQIVYFPKPGESAAMAPTSQEFWSKKPGTYGAYAAEDKVTQIIKKALTTPKPEPSYVIEKRQRLQEMEDTRQKKLSQKLAGAKSPSERIAFLKAKVRPGVSSYGFP